MCSSGSRNAVRSWALFRADRRRTGRLDLCSLEGWAYLGRVPDACRARSVRVGGRYEGLQRSRVADAAGVNLQTLRYYGWRGLLAGPDRTLGGHRLYPAETVTVLQVIKASQRLGFTLEEIADLLETGRHRRGDAGLAERAWSSWSRSSGVSPILRSSVARLARASPLGAMNS